MDKVLRFVVGECDVWIMVVAVVQEVIQTVLTSCPDENAITKLVDTVTGVIRYNKLLLYDLLVYKITGGIKYWQLTDIMFYNITGVNSYYKVLLYDYLVTTSQGSSNITNSCYMIYWFVK